MKSPVRRNNLWFFFCILLELDYQFFHYFVNSRKIHNVLDNFF